LNLPVLLVVGLKLGCINHAVLTAAAIRADGLPIFGWVANTVDPDYPVAKETIDTLEPLLDTACLGVVPHLDRYSPDTVALHLVECAKRILDTAA
jgi:dethiobiotin synthetase